MNTQKHIIRKQVISIEMAKDYNVAAIQDTIKNLYYDKILPELDVLFSTLVFNDTVISIDKIELDFGRIKKEELEQQLIQRTIHGIKLQLDEKLKFDVHTSNDVHLYSSGQSAVNEFIYFLSRGYFSWRSSAKSIVMLEDTLMNERPLSTSITSKLDALIKEKSFVTDRLIYQFSDGFLSYLLNRYIPDFTPKQLLQEIQKSVDDVPSSLKNKISVRNTFWKTALENRFLNEKEIQLQVISNTVIFISSEQSRSVNDVLLLINKSTLPKEVLNGLKAIIKTAITKQAPENLHNVDEKLIDKKISGDAGIPKGNDITESAENQDGPHVVPQDNALESLPNAEVNNFIADKTEFLKENEKPVSDKNDTERTHGSEEPIYLQLAGLVILQSFLVTFFDALELTKDRKFLNEKALHRAVQLTGYLATGDLFIEEHLLILPKLLCGMEITALIEKDVVLTERETNEANALLKQVIEYWSALKNTSPEGLRNSFFKREGKLSRGGLGWQLDVEHKTWDILLTKLPWGYSLIKLPWMKEFLFVNWN